MSISAKDVKRLRDMTGVGMMDCKKALKEADGDFDKAVEVLRKKGQKVAAKRADREAEEGLVITTLAEDNSVAAIVEVNCETDFVARNDDFQTFAQHLADRVLAERPADLDALMALPFEIGGEKTVEAEVLEMTGRIGEKIEVRRFQIVEAPAEGQVVSYTHPGSRLGVVVVASGEGDVEDAGRDVAMQVAALNPIATHRDEVPEEVLEKERDIAREAAKNEGKPEHILDRIVSGKVERFLEDHVLVEQKYVKDSSKSVQEMLDDADVEVHTFVRFALGN
jgi:elongation factor Ts